MFLVFLRFLVLIAAISCIVLIIEKGLNKLLHVKKKKVSETAGKNVDRTVRIIFVILFLSTVPFFATSMINPTFIKWFYFIYFTILMLHQAIMELKYLKNSKQYMTTLIMLFLFMIFMLNIDYFIFDLVLQQEVSMSG